MDAEKVLVDSNVLLKAIVLKMSHDLLVVNLALDDLLRAFYSPLVLNEWIIAFNKEKTHDVPIIKDHRDQLGIYVDKAIEIKPNRAEMMPLIRFFGESVLSLRHGKYIFAAHYQQIIDHKPCILVSNDFEIIRCREELEEFGVLAFTPLELLKEKFEYTTE